MSTSFGVGQTWVQISIPLEAQLIQSLKQKQSIIQRTSVINEEMIINTVLSKTLDTKLELCRELPYILSLLFTQIKNQEDHPNSVNVFMEFMQESKSPHIIRELSKTGERESQISVGELISHIMVSSDLFSEQPSALSRCHFTYTPNFANNTECEQ